MLSDSEKTQVRASAAAASRCFSLPFRRRTWRGAAGNWQGVGVGSSLDFQDHRAYVPGDDPRYINWFAYARTGQYTMKLYRSEISPVVDVALDASPSMRLVRAKWLRAVELLCFCMASAGRAGASVRIYLTGTGRAEVFDFDRTVSLDFGKLPVDGTGAGLAGLETVPWRANSLRVLISDLLFPAHVATRTAGAFASTGFTVVLAPWAHEEWEPSWEGLVELCDVESPERRVRKINPELLRRYAASYSGHFEWWRDFVRRRHGVLARVQADKPFVQALRMECPATGALEAVL